MAISVVSSSVFVTKVVLSFDVVVTDEVPSVDSRVIFVESSELVVVIVVEPSVGSLVVIVVVLSVGSVVIFVV